MAKCKHTWRSCATFAICRDATGLVQLRNEPNGGAMSGELYRAFGVSIKSARRVFSAVAHEGSRFLERDVSAPHESAGRLRQGVRGRELFIRELARLVISFSVLAVGIWGILFGEEKVREWAAGAVGLVLGYWFR